MLECCISLKDTESDKSEEDLEKRISKAQDIALEYFDCLLETTPAPDYVQVVGSIGGEVCTYRIYNDGSVYAR